MYDPNAGYGGGQQYGGWPNPSLYGMPQPQPGFRYPQRTDDNHFVWIQGREGAMAYPISPNSTLIFLDDQQPYVYKKKTDSEGKTIEFKVFKLVEEFPNNQTVETISNNPQYATKEEIQTLSEEIKKLTEIVNSRKPYSKYPKGGNRNA